MQIPNRVLVGSNEKALQQLNVQIGQKLPFYVRLIREQGTNYELHEEARIGLVMRIVHDPWFGLCPLFEDIEDGQVYLGVLDNLFDFCGMSARTVK